MTAPDYAEPWALAADRLRSLYVEARTDPVVFNAVVLRDEKTGLPVTMTVMHEEWHDLITRHDRLVLFGHLESGKTQQLSVGRVLFELGRNHNTRVVVISNVYSQAEKIVATLTRYIERSPDLREIFDLRPGTPWRDSAITVERDVISKDPSVQGCGVHGPIVGSRIDLLILDDILDYENCRTTAQRDEVDHWLESEVLGRIAADGRLICVGNAYHPEDMLHRFEKKPRFVTRRFPVIDPETGESNWPERWPLERIAQARQDLRPDEFARQMLCLARDDSQAIFRMEWVEQCKARGEGREMAYGLQVVPPGCRTITGVDLAVQQHAAADLTVLFTIIVHPDESREILSIESGRWAGPEIVERIIDTHRRYMSLVVVENNGAQHYLVQFTRGRSAVPIRPYTTGASKAHPEFGVASIATELYNGKWIIPNDLGRCHPEVDAWISEMLYYDPKTHTGDRLMASFFCREGIRMTGQAVKRIPRVDTLSR